MRILLATILYPVAISRYLCEGFREAGHEVVTAGPTTGAYIPWGGGMWLDERWAWQPDVELDPYSQHTVKDVLDKTGPVDLIVSADSAFTLHGPSPVPVVCFAVDNHVRTYDLRGFDLIFGAHSWGHRSDEPIFRWLPCAYSPDWHYDTGRERTIDVGFVGVLYERRWQAISLLVQKGYSVIAAQGKVYDEANDLYNACKMALVVSACGDLACRVFENAMQGCLVIMDRTKDAEKVGLVECEHHLGFGDGKELLAAVERGMDEAERLRIVANAQALLHGHTWKARAEQIMAEVEKLWAMS